MRTVSRSEMMRLVGNMGGGAIKKDLVTHLIETGEVSEEEALQMAEEELHTNVLEHAELFHSDDLIRELYNRLVGYPTYLARALVRAKPEVFYAYGYTFRLLLALKANLGPVILSAHAPGANPETGTFLHVLPENVQIELRQLEMECRFREWLYYFSRDRDTALLMLEEEIGEAANEHDYVILSDIQKVARSLLKTRYPECVTTLGGNPFPSFHVRWWLLKTAQESRVLNIGDTGTHKTAYAALAMREAGCERILVLCTANARLQWGSEVTRYFLDRANIVTVIEEAKDVASAIESASRFTVIAYSTLIRPGVIDALLKARPDGIIWDECQYGKNVSGIAPAQRAELSSRLFTELAPKKIVALSATPWTNHPKEFGAVAAVLKPSFFPDAESFRRARMDHARLLREFFDGHVVDVEMREIMDLPKITPQPWEDLFGVELIEPHPWHRELYEAVREDDTVLLTPAIKVQRLLMATLHPHLLRDRYCWEDGWKTRFESELLSTKLVWLRHKIDEAILRGEKVVVASGIYATGITRPSLRHDVPWVGGWLKQWFGEERVLALDGQISLSRTTTEPSDRERLISAWRTDPETMLLVSMRTCPDSINLTVPKLSGVTGLAIFPLSFGWEPWKQFLGRFWRPGQEVPVRYCAPILKGTIDEALYRLLKRKWDLLQLFRAQVPLTTAELDLFDHASNIRLLAAGARSSIERVNVISAMARGRGEQGASVVLSDEYEPGMTNGEVYAQAFLEAGQGSTSAQIARALAHGVRCFYGSGDVDPLRLFDAGCGPLTMERELDAPIFGVDMNPHMIETGRPLSQHRGANARVGHLSDLPSEWEGKFDVVFCSLVLDWTSIRKSARGLSERKRVISELARVTHPFGRVWLTCTHRQMHEALLGSWVRVLTEAGCVVLNELTGLIRARHAADSGRTFQFWSLCFSPNGSALTLSDEEVLRFSFEEERTRVVRGSNGSARRNPPVQRTAVMSESFEVVELSGAVCELGEAAQVASEKEVSRIAAGVTDEQLEHAGAHVPWRVLEQMHKRGLVNVGMVTSGAK